VARATISIAKLKPRSPSFPRVLDGLSREFHRVQVILVDVGGPDHFGKEGVVLDLRCPFASVRVEPTAPSKNRHADP
jgi:hypothetical protein